MFLRAKDRFLKFQMQVLAQIRPALGPAAATAALPKHVAKTKNVAEDVAKILEDRRIESRRSSRVSSHARVSETVIQRPLLAIGKNGVRFGNFFELLLRVRVIGVAVRMMRHRQFAIRALDFNVGGRTGDTEYLVIITFVSGQKLPPLIRQKLVRQ